MRKTLLNASIHKSVIFKGCVTRIVILSQVSTHVVGAAEDIFNDRGETISSPMMTKPVVDLPHAEYPDTLQEVNNYFHSLDLTPSDMLVFPVPTEQALVVNRIEGEKQSSISGSIKSDELSSMTFKNPKGFVISNPVVSNVLDLEFTAQGDEYYDEFTKAAGKIELQNTSLSSMDGLENLRLKAKSIYIRQSVIDPLSSVYIELLNDEKRVASSSSLESVGLLIDPNSILRASKITINNHNDSILRIDGLLQSTNGNIEIYSGGDVILHNISCNGKLIIHTPGKVVLEEDIAVNGDIEIHALSYENKGSLIANQNIDFGKTQVINKGRIKAGQALLSEAISNTHSGYIIAQRIPGLISVLARNEGTIEHLDSCTLKSDHSLDVKGTFIVHELLDCQFLGADTALTLRKGSQVKALKGANLTVHTFNNHGRWSVTGDNLKLSLTYLNNHGDIESVNGTYGEVFKLTNSATMRTLGHSTLKCTTVENTETGRFYTAGVHHVNVSGSYIDSGYVYSPTLFLLQGAYLQFLPQHQSFIANGVFQASQKLNIGAGAVFNMRHRLQFYSDNTLTHQGTNNQLQEYNKAGEEALYDSYYLLNSDVIAPRWERNVFKSYVGTFLTGEWGDYLRSLLREPYGIVTKAKGDLVRSGSDNIKAGSSLYTTFGQFKGSKSYIKTGYFSDNHAQILAESGCFTNVTLSAPAGSAVVKVDKDVEAKKFQLQAKTIAELNVGGALSLRDASVQAREVALQAQKDIQMASVTLHGQDLIHASTPGKLQAVDLHLQGGAPTLLEGDQGVQVRRLQNENPTTIKSSQQVTLEESAKGGSLAIESAGTFTSSASVEVDQFSQRSQHFQNKGKIKAKGSLQSKSQTYGDTNESALEGSDVVLDAPQTRGGFKGKVKANMAEILLKDMKLQALLQHTDIQDTLTYRVGDTIVVDEDVIVRCNLVLHALGLENKARITADKEFISFIMGDIINSGKFFGQRSGFFQAKGAVTNTGVLSVKDDLVVKAAHISNTGTQGSPAVIEGANISLESTHGSIESLYGQFKAKQAFQARSALDTKLVASEVKAGQSVRIDSARDTLVKSLVERMSSSDGSYRDYIVRSLLDLGGSISLYSGKNTTLVAAKLQAALDIGIVAQNFYSLALGLEEQETHSITDGSQTTYRLTHDVSRLQAGGHVGIHARDMNYHQATDIVARNLSMSGQDVVIDDVHDQYFLSEKTKHDGGFFGQDTERQTQRQESTSRGASFKVFETVEVKALNRISVKNIKCQAQETILEAPEVKILLGLNQMQSASTEKSSNVLWVSTTQTSEERKDHQASEFKGTVRINAKTATIEKIAGQTLDFMRTLSGDIKHLSETEVVDYYNRKSKTVEGPSQAFAMVIALAASLTGVGSVLGAAIVGTTLSSTIVGTMVSAAMTTLCSQAAVQLVAAKGNIVQAAEAMANSQVLESMAFSAVTAGITSQLCSTLNLEIDPAKKDLLDNFKLKGVEQTVNLGADIVQGSDLDASIKKAAISSVVGAVTASAAYEIGRGYANHQIDPVTHKFLHAALGASAGAIQGDDPAKGALAGAIGATVAVTVADITQKDSKTVARKALDRAERAGIEKTSESMRALIRQEIQETGTIGKISSAVSAMLLKQDMNIAIGTSNNAIENNCVETMTALALYEVFAMTGFVTSAGIGGAILYGTVKDSAEKSKDAPTPKETGGTSNDEDPRKGRKAPKREDGPRFIGKGFKDHADRHPIKEDPRIEWKHENDYYNDALANIKNGKRFTVRHDGQNKFVYITRNADGSFKFTSTTIDGKNIFTHYADTPLQTLTNAGITLPKGF